MSMMIFGTLFFSGLFLMFVFVLFGQERLSRQVRRELESQRAYLAALEQRVAALEQGKKGGIASPVTQPVASRHGSDASLSTLSFQRESVSVGAPSSNSDSLDLFMAPPQR